MFPLYIPLLTGITKSQTIYFLSSQFTTSQLILKLKVEVSNARDDSVPVLPLSDLEYLYVGLRIRKYVTRFFSFFKDKNENFTNIHIVRLSLNLMSQEINKKIH